MWQQIWVNIGSDNSLPDGTKTLPEPMLTSHYEGSVIISQ